MPKLNIYNIEALSKRSGIPQDLLLKWKGIDSKMKRNFFYDHKDSNFEKNKIIRVVKDGTMMKKFHKWLGKEIKNFDNELLFTINGGVSKKSILNAINVHIRKQPFVFIKSDLSRFFESIPRERVFTLFCSIFNCDKTVADIITNCICFKPGPVGSKEGDQSLARGLHVSSRVAIWCSIQFFRKLHEELSSKYKQFDPKVSFFVDDIGISFLTTDIGMIESIMSDLIRIGKEGFGGTSFLTLNLEKTQFKVIDSESDFIDYLGSRIYMNKKDVSVKNIEKGNLLYYLSKIVNTKEEKELYHKKLKIRKLYRKRIRAN